MRTHTVKSADIAGECGVDFEDYAALSAYWLNDCSIEPCGLANIHDDDEVVDWLDLAILTGDWLWGK